MSLKLSEADGVKMRELQREIVQVLLKANAQKVEAAVAVFALVRCMRPLMDQYNPAARETLLDLVVAFLGHAKIDNKMLVM